MSGLVRGSTRGPMRGLARGPVSGPGGAPGCPARGPMGGLIHKRIGVFLVVAVVLVEVTVVAPSGA